MSSTRLYLYTGTMDVLYAVMQDEYKAVHNDSCPSYQQFCPVIDSKSDGDEIMAYMIKWQHLVIIVFAILMVSAIVVAYLAWFAPCECGELLLDKAAEYCLANCKLCDFG